MNRFTVYGWNKILRFKLAFLKVDNARLRRQRNKARRILAQLKYEGDVE